MKTYDYVGGIDWNPVLNRIRWVEGQDIYHRGTEYTEEEVREI